MEISQPRQWQGNLMDPSEIYQRPRGKRIAQGKVERRARSVSSAVLGDWVTTAAAAKLTGYSRRQMHSLCDTGFFIEGREWRQRAPYPGSRIGGWIWIRRSALKKLEIDHEKWNKQQA